MKRFFAIVALLCGMVPQQLDAGCRVQVGHAVESAFVYTTAFVPAGIGVAAYAPYQYSYQPPATVQVLVDTNSIASAVVQQLQSQLGPVPPLPQSRTQQPTPADRPPPPIPGPAANQPAQPGPAANGPATPDVFAGAVAENCARCHSAGHDAKALAKMDLSNPVALTPEQRLACMRAVLAEKMPKGKKLTPEQAGQVLTEITGP